MNSISYYGGYGICDLAWLWWLVGGIWLWIGGCWWCFWDEKRKEPKLDVNFRFFIMYLIFTRVGIFARQIFLWTFYYFAYSFTNYKKSSFTSCILKNFKITSNQNIIIKKMVKSSPPPKKVLFIVLLFHFIFEKNKNITHIS